MPYCSGNVTCDNVLCQNIVVCFDRIMGLTVTNSGKKILGKLSANSVVVFDVSHIIFLV